jgi:hypothetical protein
VWHAPWSAVIYNSKAGRRTPNVRYAACRDMTNVPTGMAQAPHELDLFKVQEKSIVKKPHFLQSSAAQQRACTRYPIDLHRGIGLDHAVLDTQ